MLQAVADHTWQATRGAGLSLNCCIAASRICQQAAAYFGLPLRPVPTKVMVVNEAALPYVLSQIPVSSWPEGAWSVGTPSQRRRGRYAGHLIMVARGSGETVICDPSLPQFGRPSFGLDPAPLVEVISGSRWPGGPDDGRAVFIRPGHVVTYAHLDDHDEFRQAADWRDWTRRYRRLVAQVIRDVRDKREAGGQGSLLGDVHPVPPQ